MSCTFNQFTHTSNATISQLSYCPTLSSQSHDDKQLRPLHWPPDTPIKSLKSGWKSHQVLLQFRKKYAVRNPSYLVSSVCYPWTLCLAFSILVLSSIKCKCDSSYSFPAGLLRITDEATHTKLFASLPGVQQDSSKCLLNGYCYQVSYSLSPSAGRLWAEGAFRGCWKQCPFSSFPLVSFLFSPFPSPSFPSLILQAIIPNNWVLNIFYVYQSKVILSSSWYSNHIRVAKVPW